MNSKIHIKNIKAIYKLSDSNSDSIIYKQSELSNYYEAHKEKMDDKFLIKRHRVLLYRQNFAFANTSGMILGLVFGAVSSLFLTSITESLAWFLPVKIVYGIKLLFGFTVAMLFFDTVFERYVSNCFLNNSRIYIEPLEINLIAEVLKDRGINITKSF